jgi:hypothetical protein
MRRRWVVCNPHHGGYGARFLQGRGRWTPDRSRARTFTTARRANEWLLTLGYAQSTLRHFFLDAEVEKR